MAPSEPRRYTVAMRCGFGSDSRGFQSPDLMIVVAIIGILAAIAIPKFAELIRKSNEGACKGNLGSIRSALSIHYGDYEGFYPYHPAALTAGGKYMAALPAAKTPNYHSDSAKVRLGASGADLDDSGGWMYVADPASQEYGTVYVNCTHTDTKGTVWTVY